VSPVKLEEGEKWTTEGAENEYCQLGKGSDSDGE